MTDPGWHYFVDRGGTFTDIVAISPAGKLLTHKLLSEHPEQYSDAALAGIAQLHRMYGADYNGVSNVKLGTTIGTNALLERAGAATALVITAGFADLLRIGTQQRPDIFALDIQLPEPLYCEVIEADERIAADGSIVRPLDRAALLKDLIAARERGIEAVAIALINAYQEPAHELQAESIALEAGFERVSVASRINPRIRIVERGETAVVDAYLSPVLETYKAGIERGIEQTLGATGLWFMQSHGGLVEAAGFRGCDSVLSGPAGGVVGMATTAKASGYDEIIGFDMGGTSTDVSVFAGRYERTAVSQVAGCRIARPMLRINTVAAGGGSILSYAGGRLQVGPESAGANPGPACYRRGGPLTVTDANVLLGRIQPDHFPNVFGPDSNEPIDAEAVRMAFADLARELEAEGVDTLEPTELAAGFLRIAVANMAAAIEQISVQRGHDVTRFALACFGGAGGQHACSVADALGIETILVHPLAGVLSAYGIGVAEKRSIRSAGIHKTLDAESLAGAQSQRARLQAELAAEFSPLARYECRAYLRVSGSDTLLAASLEPMSSPASLAEAFAASHQRRFGFGVDSADLVLQSIDLEAIESVSAPATPPPEESNGLPGPSDEREIWFGNAWVTTPVYRRSQLGVDVTLCGPALIAEETSTVILEPDWSATVDRFGMLIMSRSQPRSRRESIDARPDPIMLEIFNNQFMHIAEQMGVVLEQTAHSVNIKERLDYSCAIFDDAGELIANAPHVPVHLGSMGDSVREVIRSAIDLSPQDAYMLNAPYRGGTHLPDVTVVTPVFSGNAARPEFFVASRAHHADIGGITPGSMPARSRTIDEEGIVIEPTRIVRDGLLLDAEILHTLTQGKHPARNPDQNLADLKAQLAANARGRTGLEQMIARYGKTVVHAYMGHVRANAEQCTRDAVKRLAGGRFAVDMDTGERIAVAVATNHATGDVRIDFTGTSGMSEGNLNAPRSVVRAVVLYVLRTLIGENIPLNAGCLVPVDLVIPEASLLDPVPPAAVAGGNVETSQCIADALLAAFGAAAASQGTMNNFTFGDDRHQYYETICGGAGASPGHNGASAVHTHMTNSRLTDVEILEQRFPVRVRRFSIREGSGGSGKWHGGDGVTREIEFLAPARLSLLAGRRRIAPFGLDGGADARPGQDCVIRSNGRIEPLESMAELSVNQGDRIVIETPGGGGYGTPDSRNDS